MKLSFKIKILCVVFLVLFSFSSCRRVDSPPPLKTMSFNIRYDNPDDGPNAWLHRKDMVARTIEFHGVDIVGLQEALDHQLRELADLLPDYAWIGVGREDGIQKGEYVPIFYRKERLALLESGVFWLSETPDVAGSMGWDAACTRVVTWAKYLDDLTGQTFYFFNTHFDHVGSNARVKSAELLLERIKAIAGNAPVIVTGDFNCTKLSKAYVLLTGGKENSLGLQDTQHIAQNGHYGGSQTYNGFSDTLRPGRTIDFIFVSGTGPVLHHGIIAERWNGRFASDHYPVTAEIYLSSQSRRSVRK
jgi:endonuclease/exonuclease/phosphatase family metal-dependent hydrolase